VEKENAILNLRPNEEATFGVDADHLSICRFADPNGSGFEIVWNSIAEMCMKEVDLARKKTLQALTSGE
jgi:hypothetical protein